MAALSLLGLGAAPCLAADGDDKSLWIKSPTEAQVLDARPATLDGQGRVVLECTPDQAGLMTGCKVVSESPNNVGLAAAALSLTKHYQKRAGATMDAPKPGTVRIVIPFEGTYDTRPDWLRKPTPEDLRAVWPIEAKGKGGRATVHCMVTVGGVLFDCAVITESPAGLGFGRAAIALTPQFVMKPATIGGKPVVSMAGVPISFGAGGRSMGPDMVKIASVEMVWTKAPTYDDVLAAYPEKAKKARVGGRVTQQCSFSDKGLLTQCTTITEEPRGHGFATAARALTAGFQFLPTDGDSKALRGVQVQLPITFPVEMVTGGPRTAGRPKWAALPSGDVVSSVYPAATAGGAGARVVLDCVVETLGKLNCKTGEEEPARLGFSEAALKMVPYFRMNTWTIEGLPTIGSALRVPIRFEARPSEKP